MDHFTRIAASTLLWVAGASLFFFALDELAMGHALWLIAWAVTAPVLLWAMRQLDSDAWQRERPAHVAGRARIHGR
jgi:hypothetical protein